MSEPYDVSVVVPFLDAERYLAEAVDSLVAQTVFDRVHVVLVDNASTDSSPAIAARYAAAHDNIEVVRHVGGGCGGARNAGIRLAPEPFIAFLDADDLLPPRSIERRLDLMRATGADLVVGITETFPVDRVWSPREAFTQDRVVHAVSDEPVLIDNVGATNKLFHRSFFDHPDHLFTEDASFEDIPVGLQALVSARPIGLLAEVCYLYRKEPTATTIMTHALTRASNLWDHLRANEAAYARHAGDPVAHDVVSRFLIRSFRPYLVSAGQLLEGDEQQEFLARARALYEHYPVGRVAGHLTRLPAAMSFYALLSGQDDLLRDPSAHVTGVEQVDGAPSLALDRPVVDALRPLLRVRPEAAFDLGAPQLTITSARTRRGCVHLAGTLEMVRGSTVHVPARGLGFALEVDLVPAADVRPGETLGPRSVAWSAELDPAGLTGQRHRVTVASPLLGATRHFDVSHDADGRTAGVTLTSSRTRTHLEVLTAPVRRRLFKRSTSS